MSLDKLSEIRSLQRTLSRHLDNRDNDSVKQTPKEVPPALLKGTPAPNSPAGVLPGKPGPAPNKYKLPPDGKLSQEDLERVVITTDGDGFVCDFDNPAEMFIALVDDITPYLWQIQELKRLGGYTDLRVKTTPTAAAPMLYQLVAANGSGKDQVIIAAFTVWYCCTGRRSRVVLSSASAQQIRDQTDPWIKWLFSLLNKYLGRVYARSVRCYHAIPELGSRAELHVTDEAGKAEGAHPDPGGRMAIILNEAKSILPEIYKAMSRCSGYDTWIEVSSPGRPAGNFYENWKDADKYPSKLALGHYWARTITGYDCPHLTESQRLSVLKAGGGGDTNPHYESSWMAQFSTVGEDLIIHPFMILAASGAARIVGVKRFGLDIGSKGDPSVIYLINGNQRVDKWRFNEPDLYVQTDKLFKYLSDWNFLDAKGYGDHNGIGQGVVDGLRARGVKITGLYNQESAYDPSQYVNLGTELHFNIRMLILAKLLALPTDDPDLHDQLSDRYYSERGNGKKIVESKKEYKKRHDGRSPDDSDAYILAFAGTNVAKMTEEARGILPLPPVDIRKYMRPPSYLNSLVEGIGKTAKKFTSWDAQ